MTIGSSHTSPNVSIMPIAKPKYADAVIIGSSAAVWKPSRKPSVSGSTT